MIADVDAERGEDARRGARRARPRSSRPTSAMRSRYRRSSTSRSSGSAGSTSCATTPASEVRTAGCSTTSSPTSMSMMRVQPVGRHGRLPARRPSHGGARRRFDHQHHLDRRDQRRRRADDVPRHQGRGHPPHPVHGHRRRRARHPGQLRGAGPHPDRRSTRPSTRRRSCASCSRCSASGRRRTWRTPSCTWPATGRPRSPGSCCPSTAGRPRAARW